MSFRLPWVSARRLSPLSILFSLIACLAGLGPGLLAQTAHFSGVVKTLASGSGFSYPSGVAVDGSGNVFVADNYNNGVKGVVAAGRHPTGHTLGHPLVLPPCAGACTDR